MMKKKNEEKNLKENEKHQEKRPDLWYVILDKRDVGTLEIFRAIHPKKKPTRGILNLTDKRENG